METKNPSAYEMLNKILELLEHMNAKMEQFVLEQVSPEPDEHHIVSVQHYISNSGNPTWKAWTADADIIYLRQAYKHMLIEARLWETLNLMDVDDVWEANITVYTVRDGDFLKVVDIAPGGRVYFPPGNDQDYHPFHTPDTLEALRRAAHDGLFTEDDDNGS